jgi:hypothetical protein
MIAGMSTEQPADEKPIRYVLFVCMAQLVGCGCAILVVRVLYPDVTPAEAAEVVLPHHEKQTSTDGALGQPVRS